MKNKITIIAISLISVILIALTVFIIADIIQKRDNELEIVEKVSNTAIILNDAYMTAILKYGSPATWCNGTDTKECSEIYGNRLSEFAEIQKDCGTGEGCFKNTNVKCKNGKVCSGNFDKDKSHRKFILADGTSVIIRANFISCNKNLMSKTAPEYSPFSKSCGWIDFDVNGPKKGSAAWGRDIFSLVMTVSGIFPTGSQDYTHDIDDSGWGCFAQGADCTDWVFQNQNTDYLNIDENGICPNGQTLSRENPSCG